MLNLVRLLDLDADARAVDAGFDQYPFILVPRHRQRVQDKLGGAASLNLRDVVSFCSLRGEVGEGEGGSQRRPYAL